MWDPTAVKYRRQCMHRSVALPNNRPMVDYFIVSLVIPPPLVTLVRLVYPLIHSSTYSSILHLVYIYLF